ncbi:hypothetical protein GGX14DRAFT_387415 [Mycena pura]|uniref:Uncharacterized protein n=1 Tax=Mycena pura TaxID=153505 RepID=A0AAD6YLC6_9AGAR|nr:hypothetical protein GGX14DRAFT_387415 [Mycena pura]
MATFFEILNPPTKLGHYRVLSPLAGIHVSPIQLGVMSIGDKWREMGMGAMDKELSFKLLDAYFDNGDGIEKRSRLLSPPSHYKGENNAIARKTPYVGNNMHISVEASLKKLRTTYIDILYLTGRTGTPASVLYLGVSDTPACVVAQASTLRTTEGRRPSSTKAVGAFWIAPWRFEREITPMARAHGLALAPFDVLME